MRTIDMQSTNHIFIKTNLVTVASGNRMYDIFKCEKCGVSGKAYQLGILVVDGRVSKKKIESCLGASQVNKIKITHCTAVGRAFANLIDGTIHDVIEPPQGHDNSRGVWVMGVGEPVKVLFNEYEDIA